MNVVSFIKKYKTPFFIAAIGLTQAHCAIDHTQPFITVGSYDHSTGQGVEKQLWLGKAPAESQDARYRQPADTAHFQKGALEGFVTQAESPDGGPDARRIEVTVVDNSRHILAGDKEYPLTYAVSFDHQAHEGHIETTGLFRGQYVAYSSDFSVNGQSVQMLDPTAFYLEGVDSHGYPRQGSEYGALTDVLRAQANAPSLSPSSQVAGMAREAVIGVNFAKQYLQSGKYVPPSPNQLDFGTESSGFKHTTTVQNVENGENETGEYHKYQVTTSIDVQAGAPPLTNNLLIKIYPEAVRAPYNLDDLVEQSCLEKIRLNPALGGYDPLVFEKLSRNQLLLSLTKLQKETSVDAPPPTEGGGFSYGNYKQVDAGRELQKFRGARSYEDLEQQVTKDLIGAFNDLPRDVKTAMGYSSEARLTMGGTAHTSKGTTARHTSGGSPATTSSRPATWNDIEKVGNGEIRAQFGPSQGYKPLQP